MPRPAVLLINTNRMKPPIAPLALDYLGAALRAAGHEPRLLDLCWESDAAAAVAGAFAGPRPELVGLTFRNTDDCYFASRASFVDVLRDDVALVRRHYDGPVVLGGIGFSVMPEQIMAHTGADYGIRGDGEESLPALLAALAGRAPLSAVPGLVWKRGLTPFSQNATLPEKMYLSPFSQNATREARIGEMRLSARELVDNRAYFAQGGQAGIETKRGCPNRCIYCADPVAKGRATRLRPPADVVAEMRNLLAQGIDHFHLCDCEFNLPPTHALELCESMTAAGLGERVRWYTYASPAPFSRALVEKMRAAGCAGINFGVDSGCDAMLAALGRDFTTKEIAETARLCREAGMVFMFDLLLGAPGETPESVAETAAFMKRVDPDRVGLSLGVRVYPGTPLAAQLSAHGPGVPGLIGDPAGLAPAFYLSPALGPDPAKLLRDLIGPDERFFLPSGGDEQDYNYNDNAVLQRAIAEGHQGAYWDILRKVRQGLPAVGYVGQVGHVRPV